jgi:hypothetical protein
MAQEAASLDDAHLHIVDKTTDRIVQTSRGLGRLLLAAAVRAHTADERPELLTAVSFSRLGLSATSSAQVVELLVRLPGVMAS